MERVLRISNRKTSVGETATTVNLSTALATIAKHLNLEIVTHRV